MASLIADHNDIPVSSDNRSSVSIVDLADAARWRIDHTQQRDRIMRDC